MRKIRALLGGALLLVAGTCFAEDQWPDSYSAGIGPDAQKEFAALPENGRAAYKTALIACSLFVDEPSNAKLKQDCKAAIAAFALEFAPPPLPQRQFDQHQPWRVKSSSRYSGRAQHSSFPSS